VAEKDWLPDSAAVGDRVRTFTLPMGNTFVYRVRYRKEIQARPFLFCLLI
jgi:hypothetical protein